MSCSSVRATERAASWRRGGQGNSHRLASKSGVPGPARILNALFDNACLSNYPCPPFMAETRKGDPIWFLPHRFWAATRNMPKEHADRLLDDVIALAEVRDVDTLRKYDFISLENPYPRRRAA